ncbi:SusC/RagA family TonB-linked outer membrane protein [Mucilaginibacter sp.]|uniref:SusC/RagA family TonB-linked outer membrane protein n=1 Tax=Mucilaginibacter sp. TaxID=1882438 RepID=UPI000CBD2988|nr:SusC/RagA family TonB-linked outer membrane protein [Mucilaginibacter sp.]PLW89726.1 MAG: SusC/RagA family TonB-linked outer membrane protein [Mucilaginibacter sp.]PMP66001.1 MAG: SusC/RagA family TonB-linked outer membrane protein [Mucilaginibacter sp.]HEK22346.1 SusC/RagA family TonB-linked outer membrane protein [Bacteroidota bacterium]
MVFSFIGYQSQEVAVAGKTTINIKLLPAAKGLNEVVVTALGITKDQKKLGYSVSTVNGDALNKAKETNVALSLQGRVAGLSVGASNGGPGSSARVLLRGLTSFTAGSPLYVINGVPMDNTQRGASGEWGGADYGDGISNINPDDIESMTVLKGQSASALYGSRAVNGVILITTKSGKKNSGFGIELNSNIQFDKPVDNTDFQQVYGQGIQGNKPTTLDAAQASGNLAWGSKMDGSDVMQIDGKMHKYSPVNNYIDFYRTAPSFTNTVAFTNGGPNGAFRLSLSDLRANSIVPNSYLDRKTFNFNGSQQVTPKLTINVVANYVLENSKNRSGLSDGPGNPNNVQFLAPNQDQATLAPGVKPDGKELTFTDDSYVTNPYFAANYFQKNIQRDRFISSLSAKYDLTKWIYAQARIGYDKSNDQRVDIEPTGTAYRNDNGTMNQSNNQITEFNADALINAKHDLVKDFLNLDLSIGGNIRKSSYTGTFINGQNGFIIPYFYSLTNFTSRSSGPLTDDPFSKKQVNSAYYSADFSIKDYLVLSTTGRYDVYSTISNSVGRGIFSPSVSGSFIFSELHKMDGVDLGKVRLSFAQTSNDAAAFANTVYYNLNNSVNGVPTAGFSSQLPNLFLAPFRLKELEAGLEMKFWGDRLGFDLAFFSRRTKNEIINANIDWSTGYTNRYIGTGSTQNRGIEVEIHGTPVRNSSFSWTPSLNFTYVKNKIIQTDGITNDNVSLGTYRPLNANLALVAGLPGPQILAYDYQRDAKGNIIIGDNGIPVQGALKPMGSTIPKMYGGLNNSFNYKQFNLGFLIDYRFGAKVLSATEYYSIFRGLNKSTLPGRETGVVAQGVLANGQPNTLNVPAQTYYQGLARNISASNVLNGDFIKLRQVTLGYTFNAAALRGTPFSSIGVSAVARNLWTIMKHTKNIDPESGFSNDVRYTGIEGTSLPFTRTYGLNLNFKFKN